MEVNVCLPGTFPGGGIISKVRLGFCSAGTQTQDLVLGQHSTSELGLQPLNRLLNLI